METDGNREKTIDQNTEMKMKRCLCCGETLPIIQFHKNHTMSDGHTNICKECTKKRRAEARAIKNASSKSQETKSGKRPVKYTPQPGNKATFSLADFSDDNIFAELRRRGFRGSLEFSKTVSI